MSLGRPHHIDVDVDECGVFLAIRRVLVRVRGVYSYLLPTTNPEEPNNKIKLTIRKAYGYRQLKVAEIALYHALGHLPEPEVAHRFC